MTKRYTGGVVSSAVPTVNAAGASGVFLLSQQADYQSKNNWPPFKVEKSLRFRGSASAQLSKTFASVGNKKTWTFSFWVKRGLIPASVIHKIFTAENPPTYDPDGVIGFGGSSYTDNLRFQSYVGGVNAHLVTTQVFRDPSAWYHIIVAVDSTQATSTNRVKIYVNGSQVTAFTVATYPSQNGDLSFNGAYDHILGSAGYNFDGYLSDTYFIDGQQLTPSSFGATDKDGNWSPIAYTGTYGQNGFYLNFKDATSTTTIGYDYSGNGNNWTASGLNVATANTTYDSVIDVPSDQSGANTILNRGNYARMLSVDAGTFVVSEGGLKVTSTSGYSSNACLFSSLAFNYPVYFEIYFNSSAGYDSHPVNIIDASRSVMTSGMVSYYSSPYAWGYYGDGNKVNNGTATSYGSSYTTGDTIGVAADPTTGKVWFSKNGTWQASGDPAAGTNPAFTGLPSSLMLGWGVTTSGSYGTSVTSYNFGQRPFAYTPPAGFKTLNTYHLPEPTIKQPNQHFNAVIYTGNSGNGLGTTQNVTVGFAPDMVWIKDRSAAQWHNITDSVRGSGKEVFTNSTGAEETNSGVTLGSNGFTANAWDGSNKSGDAFISWNWKASSSNTTNTSGTQTAQVRVNSTAGFSIATFATPSSGNFTVGHGLPAAPHFMIIKNRSGTNNWTLYHRSTGATGYLLYTSGAFITDSRPFNDTTPGATTWASSVDGWWPATQNLVAYSWTEIPGYSSFGSYTGNGADDGPFIYTGFRPRFVYRKCVSTTGENHMQYDTAVNPYNASAEWSSPNLADASNTAGGYYIDFLSNGFKIRHTATGNNSGRTYIYAAFAEVPFKYSRSR
jgi:hypothetical protein